MYQLFVSKVDSIDSSVQILHVGVFQLNLRLLELENGARKQSVGFFNVLGLNHQTVFEPRVSL